MLSTLQNWRTWLAIIAIAIVSGTILYSQYLARKIAGGERTKVLQWVEAGKLLINDSTGISNQLVGLVIADNTDIPIIETNERDSIISFVNIDTFKVRTRPDYLPSLLNKYRSNNDPITWINPSDSTQMNRYYYGSSFLLAEVEYYPIVQLFIVALFILITVLSLQTRNRSVQNQLWAGMAKETAHQLGTPVSSLEGWVEVLKDAPADTNMIREMAKDVERLKLVSDRFGKIGSTPQLEQTDLLAQVNNMVDYIRKRATGKVQFEVSAPEHTLLNAEVSPPLFDWVMENLLKNTLDAMDGKGNITVTLLPEGRNIIIEVRDSGKGIPRQHWQKVFAPGFTTKKRGWGLGLSLTKRIVEQFHNGRIFVKQSDASTGTTFRIEMPIQASQEKKSGKAR